MNTQLLDEYLSQLERARAWSARTISKLESLILADDEKPLFRLDPLQFAREKNVPEPEAVDLLLHAAKIGLFNMEWHLVCASCGGVVESFRQLASLHAHFICRMCSAENTADLDETIRVGFTINPAVRLLRYHHPEKLSIEELYLDYYFSRHLLPYPDGRHLRDILRDVAQIRAYLEPGETRSFEVQASPGLLHATNAASITSVAFGVSGEPAVSSQQVSLCLVDGKFQLLGKASNPQNLPNPSGFISVVDHFDMLSKGPVTFHIQNDSPQRAALWMIHAGPDFPTESLRYTAFLSGKQLLATPAFRDLFRSESISGDEGLSIKEATFLFTDLKGSTEMYEQIGDPQAFFLVRQHFDLLGQIVAQYRGAVVKTIGDAVMATFLTPQDALRAALAMNYEIAGFNQRHAARLVLKIGLHRGHSIAVTLNDRLDYFGQTINIAARVQAIAGASEICLTEDVYSAPDVSALLASKQVRAEQAALKGVSAPLTIWRVAETQTPLI